MQTESLGPATISRSARYALTSRTVDQTFLIDVAMPAAKVAPGQTVPVVYVLDGNGMFAMTAQMARILQSGPDPLRPMLVVGVGYRYRGGGGPNWEYTGLRLRDLTPTSDPQIMARLRASPPPYDFPPDYRMGGAAAFRAFLETELKPFIAANYPADMDDQTLLGFSLAGLFAIDTLFAAPGAFRRCIAGSPALSWDERMVFAREAAFAATADDLPVQLFLSVGGLEEPEQDPASHHRVSYLADLHSVLQGRRYPGLSVVHHVFPDETHASVVPAMLSRGLRSVFGRA